MAMQPKRATDHRSRETSQHLSYLSRLLIAFEAAVVNTKKVLVQRRSQSVQWVIFIRSSVHKMCK